MVKKSKKKTEIAIHSDEEFEQSLLQIDEINCIENQEKTPEKNQVNETKNDIKKNETKSAKNHDLIYNKDAEISPKTSSKRKLDTSVDVKKEIETNPKQNEKSSADFSEFVNDEEHDDNDKSNEPKSKKLKMDKTLNESGMFQIIFV